MQSPEKRQKHIVPRCDATILHHIRSWAQSSDSWHQKKAARPNSYWVIAHVHHVHCIFPHSPGSPLSCQLNIWSQTSPSCASGGKNHHGECWAKAQQANKEKPKGAKDKRKEKETSVPKRVVPNLQQNGPFCGQVLPKLQATWERECSRPTKVAQCQLAASEAPSLKSSHVVPLWPLYHSRDWTGPVWHFNQLLVCERHQHACFACRRLSTDGTAIHKNLHQLNGRRKRWTLWHVCKWWEWKFGCSRWNEIHNAGSTNRSATMRKSTRDSQLQPEPPVASAYLRNWVGVFASSDVKQTKMKKTNSAASLRTLKPFSHQDKRSPQMSHNLQDVAVNLEHNQETRWTVCGYVGKVLTVQEEAEEAVHYQDLHGCPPRGVKFSKCTLQLFPAQCSGPECMVRLTTCMV